MRLRAAAAREVDRPAVRIVEEVEVGSDAEFRAFWSAHHDRVQRALTLSLGDPLLAADATDEAFTRAYQQWAKVRDYDAPGGWCYRVGSNWATSWRRRMAIRPTRPVEALERGVEDVVATPMDARLLLALRALPERQRSAVVARHYLDLSMSSVADLLGVEQSTARTHLQRGLTALRTELAKDLA